MLVAKFSDGKYKNEGELFAEPISDENVKLMGENDCVAGYAHDNAFDLEIVGKLYRGLVKDLHHMNDIGYTISDSYDYAQIAICFLLEFKGMRVTDEYGIDRRGKTITIKICLLIEKWIKYSSTTAEILRSTGKLSSTTTNSTFPTRRTALKTRTPTQNSTRRISCSISCS